MVTTVRRVTCVQGQCPEDWGADFGGNLTRTARATARLMTNRGPVTLSIDEVDILLDLLGRPEPDESYHVKSLRTKVRSEEEQWRSGAGVVHTDA
jgi:hypothetical protein